jgi:hypothetical protein
MDAFSRGVNSPITVALLPRSTSFGVVAKH